MPKIGYGYGLYTGSPSSRPSDISGLRLWLKADAGVQLSNNLVSSWEDQSGNNNNFTGSNAELIPNFKNGQPSVYFNANNSPILTSPTSIFDGLSSLSFIVVCKAQPEMGGEPYFYNSRADFSFYIADADPGINVYVGDYQFLVGDGINFFQSSLFGINYLDATTGNGSAFQNGIASVGPFVSQITISDAGTPTSDRVYTRTSGGTTFFSGVGGNVIEWAGSVWYLYDDATSNYTYFNSSITFDDAWQVEEGDAPAPSQSLVYSYESAVTPSGVTLPIQSGTSLVMGRETMYLSELLIYNKRLSTTERKQIEGYLNAKYAIY